MMKTYFSLIVLISTLLLGCSSPEQEFKTGIWKGIIELQGQKVPFTFRVEKDSSGNSVLYLINGKEELLCDEIVRHKNKLSITLHVFDAELKATLKNDTLNGLFILHYRKNAELPFRAVYGQDIRFKPVDSTAASADFSGKYQVFFTSEQESYPAIGMVQQKGNYATGSFITETGDYRYLEGGVFNDTLFLSSFDGNHTFLFKATKKNDTTLQGQFWSHKNEYFKWTAWKKENPSLPDPEKATTLKNGFDSIVFCFPTITREKICLTDSLYRNKVVVVYIFGTWCPTGMDQTKFLVDWYNQNSTRGIEVIGLAYERKDDFNYAKNRVQKTIEKCKVPYQIVIAGINDKKLAAKTLPALNKLISFPTTLIVGKDGKVKYIYTGFIGPGTGSYHQEFSARFNEMIDSCLSE